MRIVVSNSTIGRIGGVENYLAHVIPALIERGHELSFLAERIPSTDRAVITTEGEIPIWYAESMGADRALNRLLAWKPDLLFAHKSENPLWESRLQRIAPSVFFAHDYQGLCISGDKTHKFPSARPCTRRFGPACLLRYFPRHCGGHNPLTMLSLFATQGRRLSLFKRYTTVVTHSRRMAVELRRLGIVARRVRSYPVSLDSCPDTPGGTQAARGDDLTVRLVFSSRMEFLKGGHLLLQAVPEIVARLKKPLHLTMIGDGRERSRLEREAARLCTENRSVQIVFTGWLNSQEQSKIFEQADLLVAPSLWPEPFGMSGLEAGLSGVPTAAFAVGGIPDWLQDGVNGALAAADPPTSAGLADAVHRCLVDPAAYDRLRAGAIRAAMSFNMKDHLVSLMEIFERVLGGRENAIE